MPYDYSPGQRRRPSADAYDPAAEFLVQTLYGICRPSRFPLRRIKAGEGEEAIAGLFQPIGDSAALQAPFAHKSLATRFHLG